MLDGEVTLAVDGAVGLVDDIVYASAIDPSPYDDDFELNAVDDQLGLIARDRVEIQTTTDINIHAAIMVTEGDDGFGAEYRYSWLGNPSIYLFGSIAQFRRGIVGTVGGMGFRKNYVFDTRFDLNPPPHYPYSAYKMREWSRIQ